MAGSRCRASARADHDRGLHCDGPRPRQANGSRRGGNFTLAAFVHRFTAGCVQALAAIGATASYLEAERKGFSTFELTLEVAGWPRLGDPVLVETGIAHLGNSSIRFIHRMSDPVDGREFARLGQFGVQLDLDARRPAALPAALKAAAQRLLLPVG
jgi:acyl-CoA thioesterase FadM